MPAVSVSVSPINGSAVEPEEPQGPPRPCPQSPMGREELGGEGRGGTGTVEEWACVPAPSPGPFLRGSARLPSMAQE